MQKIKLTFWMSCILALLSGCGYALIGSRTILPPDVKMIAIPMVVNNTSEPNVGQMFTEQLRDRFERYGVVTVVEEPGDGDAVLRVVIEKIKRSSHSVSSSTSASLRQNATITVSGELRHKNGAVIWKSDGMNVSKPYSITQKSIVTTSADFASGSLSGGDLQGLATRELSRSQEQQAFSDLLDTAATKIYDEAVAADF